MATLSFRDIIIHLCRVPLPSTCIVHIYVQLVEFYTTFSQVIWILTRERMIKILVE